MNNKKELTIALVGAGNLATHLAKALTEQGYPIAQVFSRTLLSAKCLADEIGAAYTNNLSEVINNADWYIVSLTDSAFIEQLPHIVKDKNKKALFVHTAGSIPMDIWKGHVERYGVFYPMQTFSKKREVNFKEIPLFIEANHREDVDLMLDIAHCISDKVYEASSKQRKNLHVAAVFACNFTNHMYALTSELLAKNDLPFEVMLPLIDETARKVHQLAPNEAQTGPARRGDAEVMEEHVRMLSELPELATLYKAVSDSIHKHHIND